MNRKLCVAAVAVFLGAALAAAQTVNFSGTWVLDKSKSDPLLGEGLGGLRGGPGGGFPGGRGGMGGGMPGGRGGAGGGVPGARGGAPGERGDMAGLRNLQNADITLEIQHTEKEIQVVRVFKLEEREQSHTQVLKLDGSASVNPAFLGRGEVKSKATFKSGKITNNSDQKISTPLGEMTISTKEEFTLSKDGQTLTVKTTRITDMGEMTSKQVFTKQ